jgi:hypothetical protein
VNNPDRHLTIQLLRCSSLLIHNLSDESSKSFLISSGFFSELISSPYDFSDDEIIENYTSMLKGFSVNLSQNLLLHLVTSKNFSLFTCALMFFNHSENLVKTAARTVVINILKCNSHLVNNPYVNDYIVESGFFFNLANSIRDSLSAVSKGIKSTFSRLEELVFDLMDTIFYINDIFQEQNEKFNEKIWICLKRVVIFPVICGSIINVNVILNYHVPISVGLYFLCQLLLNVPQNIVKNFIPVLLFQDVLPKNLLECMKSSLCSEDEVLEDHLENGENVVLSNLKSFIQCRDDALVALSLSLVHSALLVCRRRVLKRVGLLPGLRDEVYMMWVGIVGDVLSFENGFSFYTYLTATKCLYQMLSSDVQLSYSVITQIFKNLTIKLSEQILHKSANKSIPPNFSKLMKTSWEYIQKQVIHEKQTIPITFLSPALDETRLSQESQRSIPETKELQHLMRCFWLYRRIYSSLQLLEEEKSYPISSSLLSDLDLSKTYRITDTCFYDKPKIILRVKHKSKISSKVLVRDENFLILLGKCQIEEENYRVDFIENLTQVFLPENVNPKVLTVLSNTSGTLELCFDDLMEWLSIKNFYEKQVKNAKTYQMIELQNFLRDQKRIIESLEDVKLN